MTNKITGWWNGKASSYDGGENEENGQEETSH